MKYGCKLSICFPAGELCACKILEKFNITQPTLSYHIKILTEGGLVAAVRDGAWMRYSLNEASMQALLRFLAELTSEKVNCSCRNEQHGERK